MANLVPSPGITLTRSIYGCNGINKRVRGSSIKDLKLGRKGGKGGSQSIYAYSPIIGLVLSYTPLLTCVNIYNRPHDLTTVLVTLKNFLYIYEAIKVVINSFKFKAFKNKDLILINIKIIYLNMLQ
jgi:hypothetical protein